MAVGRPCPPVRNDSVTPRHMFLSVCVDIIIFILVSTMVVIRAASYQSAHDYENLKNFRSRSLLQRIWHLLEIPLSIPSHIPKIETYNIPKKAST